MDRLAVEVDHPCAKERLLSLGLGCGDRVGHQDRTKRRAGFTVENRSDRDLHGSGSFVVPDLRRDDLIGDGRVEGRVFDFPRLQIRVGDRANHGRAAAHERDESAVIVGHGHDVGLRFVGRKTRTELLED